MNISRVFSLVILLVIGILWVPKVLAQSINAEMCQVKFTVELRFGDTHTQVLALQKFLNSDTRTLVSKSGPGSLGNETDKFGSATSIALRKLQVLLKPLGLKNVTGILDTETRTLINEYCENYRKGLTKKKETENSINFSSKNFTSKIFLSTNKRSRIGNTVRIDLTTKEEVERPSKTAIVCDGCTVRDVRKTGPLSYLIFINVEGNKPWSTFVEADRIKNKYGKFNETASNVLDNSSLEISVGSLLNTPALKAISKQTQYLKQEVKKAPYQNLVVAEFNLPEDTDYYTYICLNDSGKTATNNKIINKIEYIPFTYESLVYFFDKSFDKSVELYKGFINMGTRESTGLFQGIGKKYGKMSISQYALYRLDTKTSRFDFTRRIGDYNRVPRGSMCKTNARPGNEGYVIGKYVMTGRSARGSSLNLSNIEKHSSYPALQKEDFLNICLPEWDKYSALETTNYCENPKSKVIFLPEATIKYYYGQELDLRNELDIKKIIGSLFEIYTPSGSCHLGTLWGILPEKYEYAIGLNPNLYEEVSKYKDLPATSNRIEPESSNNMPALGDLVFRPVPLDNSSSTKISQHKNDITSGLGCLELRKKYSYWDELENDELWNQEFLVGNQQNNDAGGFDTGVGEGEGEGDGDGSGNE